MSSDANASGEMIYRRIHRASRELLFDCMTTPRHLANFWGPDGTVTPLDGIVVELWPGGRFETLMVNTTDGRSHRMRAVYVEVDRPAKLAWREIEDDGGMATSVTFIDLGDGHTEVVTHQTNMPPAYVAHRARQGFATSLDRFDAYVRGLAPH